MKFLLLFFCVTTLTFSPNAQSYKPGIYKTYQEFVSNSPSIPFTYEVKEHITICPEKVIGPAIIGARRKKIPIEKIITYEIRVKKSDAKKMGTIVGFSDGKHIYFLSRPAVIDKKVRFARAQFIENSHFFFLDWTHLTVIQEGSIVPPGFDGVSQPRLTACHVITKVVSAKTAKDIILTEEEVEKIVNEDNALFMKFKMDKNRTIHLKRYVQEFIKRNY